MVASIFYLAIFNGFTTISVILPLFGAGLIYGLFTIKYVYDLVTSRKLLTCSIWFTASVLSYAIAVQITLLTAPSTLLPQPDSFNYALGGFFWSAHTNTVI